MRNLKRVLSLVMATAMLVSMMAVGASASYENFTDSSSIVNTEAVGTMVTLGVINGRDTGEFDPTGTVTRAEMAKMITVALNGGTDPNLGSATTTFTDTQGHWAEAYIAYCANLGIINGMGDGTFAPDAAVTGTAAAKMMLTALGYDSTVEGLTGSGWDLNTDILANKIKLYDGLETITLTAGLSRDYAAQLIYNGVQAQEIWYYTDDATGISYKQEQGSLLSNSFGVVKVTGVVIANEFADLTTDDSAIAEGRTTLDLIEENDDHAFDDAVSATLYFSSDESHLGRTVTVFAKLDSTTPSSASKATIVGAPVLADENVVVVHVVDESSDTDYDQAGEIADDYDLTVNATYTDFYENYNASASTASTYGVAIGEELTFIDNDDDGYVDYMFSVKYSFGEVNSYSTSADTMRVTVNSTTWDFEDVVGYADVAHQDLVLWAEMGGRLYVEVADSVEGTFTQYKTSSDDTIKVDGTTYTISGMPSYNGVYTDDLVSGIYFTTNDAASNLDEDIIIYFDKFGYVVAVDADGTDAQYALVTATTSSYTDSDGWNVSGNMVKVVFADGTTGVYEDVTTAAPYAVVGGLYTYEIDDDEITFGTTGRYGYTTATDVVIDSGKVTATFGSTSYYASDDTAYFYITLDDTTNDNIADGNALDIEEVATYVGYSNVSSFDMDDTTAYVFVDGTDLLAVAVISDATALSGDWMYVYDVTGTTSDGYVVDAIVNGDMESDIVVDYLKSAGWDGYGYTMKYSIDSDGIYNTDSITGSQDLGYISYKGSNSILVGGVEYEITSSTVIGNIDGGDTTIDGVALVKGDYVKVIHDDYEAVAVLVLVPYETDYVSFSMDASGDSDVTDIDVDYSALTITVTGDLANITDNDICSYIVLNVGPTYNYTNSSTNSAGASQAATGTQVSEGLSRYLYIFSEDGVTTQYTLIFVDTAVPAVVYDTTGFDVYDELSVDSDAVTMSVLGAGQIQLSDSYDTSTMIVNIFTESGGSYTLYKTNCSDYYPSNLTLLTYVSEFVVGSCGMNVGGTTYYIQLWVVDAGTGTYTLSDTTSYTA